MHFPKLFSQKKPWAWLAVALFSMSLAVQPAQAQPFAYVANASTYDVSVIDVASNTVTATVPTAGGLGVAITPDGAFAYAAAPFLGVVVIDVASNTVVATVPTVLYPVGVAITPDGAFAYVVDLFFSNVAVIATASNTVVATVPVGAYPQFLAITPDGAFAYVTNFDSHDVSVIATASNTVVATVPVGLQPLGVAITPDGAFAYVTIGGHDYVAVIDVASNTVVATVVVGLNPRGVAITPDGAFAYVTNGSSDDVSVIDVASNTVVATVPVGDYPQVPAITPDGAFVYVTNGDSDDVSAIATASNTVVATVPVVGFPIGIAITPASSVSVDDLIDDLIAEIEAMGIQGGVANALISKLENALASYQAGNYTAATNQLNAFINQCNAQRGKKLTNAQADQLIAAAQVIIDQINSSSAPAIAKTSTPAVHAAAQSLPASEIRFSRSETGELTMKHFAASGQELRAQSLSREKVAVLKQQLAKRGEAGTPALRGLQVEKLMQLYATVLVMVENGDEVILTLPRDGKDFKISKAGEAARGAKSASLPSAYALEQNYPNPFNPETEIRFALPEAGQVTVKIFNTTGQEIRTLANASFQAGHQTLRWDGRNEAGTAVAAGVYLYQITATGANGEVKFSATKRMAFVK